MIVANGQDLHDSIKDLNLTPEQTEKVRAILKATRNDFKAMLTTEQRKALRQKMRSVRR